MTQAHAPHWKAYESISLNDQKHNAEHVDVPFPGYIANSKEYPFGFNYSMLIGIDTENYGLFSCTDDQPSFKKNLAIKGESWRYATQQVTYRVNSHGFRTKEWNNINWRDSIVLIGCSCTFGVGVDESETITHFLEKSTGRPVINLGIPGCSNNVILDNATALYHNFGVPHAVVILWTVGDRFRFYGADGWYDVGAWTNRNEKFDQTPVGRMWELRAFNKVNEIAVNYNIAQTASALWKDRTKYITISFFDWMAHIMRAERSFTIDNSARDLIHPGVGNSLEVASYIKQRLDIMK